MLLSISLILGMLILWLAITAVCIGMAAYRGIVSLREEESLYIDAGEEGKLREQAKVAAQVERISKLFWITFGLSVAFGVLTFGLWVYQQLTTG
jgi:hypothetical protein